MELVTMPELKDGNDAASFVHELQMILQTIGTCDGKMHGKLHLETKIQYLTIVFNYNKPSTINLHLYLVH